MYELIKKNETSRYYKMDFTIVEGLNGSKLKKPTNLIMVSDAHTHIERLVFPLSLREGNTMEEFINGKKQSCFVSLIQIAGKMTFMIEGGDPTTVLADEEYIKQLHEHNKSFNQ